jgi:hypothetical protein
MMTNDDLCPICDVEYLSKSGCPSLRIKDKDLPEGCKEWRPPVLHVVTESNPADLHI